MDLLNLKQRRQNSNQLVLNVEQLGIRVSFGLIRLNAVAVHAVTTRTRRTPIAASVALVPDAEFTIVIHVTVLDWTVVRAIVVPAIAVHAIAVPAIAVYAFADYVTVDPIRPTSLYPILNLHNKIRPAIYNSRQVLSSMCTDHHMSSSPFVEIFHQ